MCWQGNDLQHLQERGIQVERILLELVRPDPVQPRRVLPEAIHVAFHSNRLTPTQALRELVQMVQVTARQRGRPFHNVLELLPGINEDHDDLPELALTRKNSFYAIWSISLLLSGTMGRSIRSPSSMYHRGHAAVSH